MNNKLVFKAIAFSLFLAVTTSLSDDAMMQAVCAALVPNGFISAVRKPCSNVKKTETCEIICKNAACSMRTINGNQGSTAGTCLATYHLYFRRNRLNAGETGKASIAMLGFGVDGCKDPWCGPNFCCCKT